ncbi:MAG TPA: hypothetical protein VFU35_13265 [Jatrophihabitans sp.]|nr:hypothetical protein [Jatrophihabitans sp.]
MTSCPSTGRRRAWPVFVGKDWVATGLVADVVVTYADYLALAHARFIDTIFEMAWVPTGVLG